jgi:conjugal transfer pilus assembly protein TraV
MSIKPIFLAIPVMLASLSACATLGTNVAGDFSCRAPKGGCAPTATIDAAATAVSPDSVSERPPLAFSTLRTVRLAIIRQHSFPHFALDFDK